MEPRHTFDSIDRPKVSRWRSIQKRLAQKVISQDCFAKPPRHVGGVDVAYDGDKAFGSAVVLSFDTLEIVESATATSKVEAPYVSSFLAFRELKPIAKVVKRLNTKPDILLVDAHGVAHPERCGCASHIGVVLDVPTIGVAKTVLVGEISAPDAKGMRYLRDRGKIIGAAITSCAGSKPIFVSVGHEVSLQSAIEIAQKTIKGYRIPEPLRLAHRLSNFVRASAMQKSRLANAVLKG